MAAADPQSANNHLKLGDAYLQQGKLKEAVSEFETSRRLAPKDPLVNSMLALSFNSSGRIEDAQKAYRDTLALQSNNPQVKNNLAYLMAETGGNLDEAMRMAQDATKAMPADTRFSDTLGWIYFKKKNDDSAIQVLTNIVLKEPKQPVYHYHLAAALLDKGDKVEARKQLQEAIINHPTPAYAAKIQELMAKDELSPRQNTMSATHEDNSPKTADRGPSDRSFGYVGTAAFLFFGLWPLRHWPGRYGFGAV